MAQGLYPVPSQVITVTAIAATATQAAFAIPLADEFTIVINCTAATGTSPTLDWVLQSSFDKGTTYANLPLRSAQITAAGVHYFTFRRGLGWGEAAFNQAGVADTGGALAKNCVFDPAYMKFKSTIGGTNPSFTYKVAFLANPRGSNGAI